MKQETKQSAPAVSSSSSSKAAQPAAEPAAEPTAEPAAPAAAPAQAPAAAAGSPKEIAQGMIGSSASALVAAIGEPSSTEYATSCIGDGEDGIWYYDGFTVYTFRGTDGSERIEDVF